MQRRIKHWRATRGPDKEVFFSQEHVPRWRTDPSALLQLSSGRKISWTICRIPVRPFDSVMKAGQPVPARRPLQEKS